MKNSHYKKVATIFAAMSVLPLVFGMPMIADQEKRAIEEKDVTQILDEGKIVSIDPATQTANISVGNAPMVTVKVTPQTKLTKFETGLSANDLKVGDKISLTAESHVLGSIETFTVVKVNPLRLVLGNLDPNVVGDEVARVPYIVGGGLHGVEAVGTLIVTALNSTSEAVKNSAVRVTLNITKPDAVEFVRVTPLKFAGLSVGQILSGAYSSSEVGGKRVKPWEAVELNATIAAPPKEPEITFGKREDL